MYVLMWPLPDMGGVVTAMHFVLTYSYDQVTVPKTLPVSTLLNCQSPYDHMHGKNPLWPPDFSEKYKPHLFHHIWDHKQGHTSKYGVYWSVHLLTWQSQHVIITWPDHHILGNWRVLHHHAACWLVNIHITRLLPSSFHGERMEYIYININGFDMICQGSQAISICATFLFENSVANLR